MTLNSGTHGGSLQLTVAHLYLIEVVVEVHIASTEISAQQRSVRSKYCGDINMRGAENNQTHSRHPLMKVTNHLGYWNCLDSLPELN